MDYWSILCVESQFLVLWETRPSWPSQLCSGKIILLIVTAMIDVMCIQVSPLLLPSRSCIPDQVELCQSGSRSFLIDQGSSLVIKLLWCWQHVDTANDLTQLIISKMFPVRILLYTVKALYYPKKVLAGMKHAAHVLPGNFLGEAHSQYLLNLKY